MKKLLILIVTISSLFTFGCGKANYVESDPGESNGENSIIVSQPENSNSNSIEDGSNQSNNDGSTVSEQQSKNDNNTAPEQQNSSQQSNSLSGELSSEKVNLNKISSVSSASQDVSNPFFFSKGASQVSYSGKFLFSGVVQKNVNMNIIKVADLKLGELYELKIDHVDGVSNERLSLGYFYVQQDKIYKINSDEENLGKLETSEELPSDSVIVCQEQEIKDTLGEDEAGFHQYITVGGNIREYHSYNNQVSTGYYESFTWEKNKGLVGYRSGFGAERDSIELQLQ